MTPATNPLHKDYPPQCGFCSLLAPPKNLDGNPAPVDGNKRTGFMAAYIFLDRNGFELTAPEAEATAIISSLAAGEIDESALAVWIRQNVSKARKT